MKKIIFIICAFMFSCSSLSALELDKVEFSINNVNENDLIDMETLNINAVTDNLIIYDYTDINKYDKNGNNVESLVKEENYYHFYIEGNHTTNCYTSSNMVTYACNLVSFGNENLKIKLESGYKYIVNFRFYSNNQDTINDDTIIKINNINNVTWRDGGYVNAPLYTVSYEYNFIDYNVNVDSSIKNGKISISKNSARKGDIVNLSITPNKGYILDKVVVLDKDNNNVEITDNSFVMPDSDVSIKATFKPIEYKFMNENNLIYQGEDLVFKVNGDYSLFEKVYINDVKLDKNNYTSKEGSTIITLLKNYLNTLEAGTYNIKVSYITGVTATSKFIIKEKTNIENPNTGDNILIYGFLTFISTLGFVSSKKYLNKRR